MPLKPVRKLVVLTHPFFDSLRLVGRGEAPPKVPRGLKSLLSKAAKERGTHVVVSWSNNSAQHGGLNELLFGIPRERVHEPMFNVSEGTGTSVSYAACRADHNYFIDDSRVVNRLKGLEFAPSVEIVGWGDYHDTCHAINLSEVADFVEGEKHAKVERIRILGGTPTVHAKSLLYQAAKGKAIPKSRRVEYERERDVFLSRLEGIFGRHMQKLEVAWPKLKGR